MIRLLTDYFRIDATVIHLSNFDILQNNNTATNIYRHGTIFATDSQ